MTHFSHLRRTPWTPTFDWYPTVHEVADRINSFHEDYPQRVDVTRTCVGSLPVKPTRGFYRVKTGRLSVIHRMVFGDTTHAGSWRDVGKGAGADCIVARIERPLGDSDSRAGCHYHTDLANERWRGL